jgi:MtN3 and saliva related transmembrane protein
MLLDAPMTEVIGWISSALLVLTIGKQVYKQWHDGTSKGVSRWLFLGQMLASAGFTLYSWLVHNWVFVVTNALMLLSAILGYLIVLTHRRREARSGSQVVGAAGVTRPATTLTSSAGEAGFERCSS